MSGGTPVGPVYFPLDTIARIEVPSTPDGIAWPVVERVPGGWQSGAHHYRDAEVRAVEVILAPRGLDTVAVPDDGAQREEGAAALVRLAEDLREDAASPTNAPLAAGIGWAIHCAESLAQAYMHGLKIPDASLPAEGREPAAPPPVTPCGECGEDSDLCHHETSTGEAAADELERWADQMDPRLRTIPWSKRYTVDDLNDWVRKMRDRVAALRGVATPKVPATSQKVPDLGAGPAASPTRMAAGHCGAAWSLGIGQDPLTWDGEKHEPHEWTGAAGDRVWCPGWPVQALDGQRPIVPSEFRP